MCSLFCLPELQCGAKNAVHRMGLWIDGMLVLMAMELYLAIRANTNTSPPADSPPRGVRGGRGFMAQRIRNASRPEAERRDRPVAVKSPFNLGLWILGEIDLSLELNSQSTGT